MLKIFVNFIRISHRWPSCWIVRRRSENLARPLTLRICNSPRSFSSTETTWLRWMTTCRSTTSCCPVNRTQSSKIVIKKNVIIITKFENTLLHACAHYYYYQNRIYNGSKNMRHEKERKKLEALFIIRIWMYLRMKYCTSRSLVWIRNDNGRMRKVLYFILYIIIYDADTPQIMLFILLRFFFAPGPRNIFRVKKKKKNPNTRRERIILLYGNDTIRKLL